MTEYAPNPLFWIFTGNATAPTPGRSKSVDDVWQAALAAERDGRHEAHSLGGSVRVAINPQLGCPLRVRPPLYSAYGTGLGAAAVHARRWIADQRAELAEIEAQLTAYGPETFVMPLTPVAAPTGEWDAHTQITRLFEMATGRRLWVHGVEFAVDHKSGGRFRAVSPAAT